MKWDRSPKPKLNDNRIITKFLFLPVEIGRETRWLERVRIRQAYGPVDPLWGHVCCGYGWENIEFVEDDL